MFFTSLLLLAAFLIEGIGTYVSVQGLAALFSSNIVIIILAVSLDLAKIVAVSFLYRHWRDINMFMKCYMTTACAVLMLITSAGAFGFLSAEFQKAITSTNSQGVVIKSMQDEQTRLQKRKEEIDRQIAQLPDTNTRGRVALIKQFGPEVTRINDRLAEIDSELPKLQVETIKKNVEVGPIIYIAEAFSTTPEQAVKWVILTIIFVFDPLAVALLICGNFLIRLQKERAEISERTQQIVQVPQYTEPENQTISIPPQSQEQSPPRPTERVTEVSSKPEPEDNFPEIKFTTPEAVMPVAVTAEESAATVATPQEEAELPVVEIAAEQTEHDQQQEVELVVAAPEPEEIVSEPAAIKSCLESPDIKGGDVELDFDDRRNMRHLKSMYSNG